MRLSKVVHIEGRGEVTVKEISPAGVYRAYKSDDKVESFLDLVDDAVSPAAREIMEWYPSEIDQVLQAIFEVNASFFELARRMKLDGLMTTMMQSLQETLPPVFASSFKQAMQASGVTAGVSS